MSLGPIEATLGEVILLDRRKYHVTSTRNGSVYGHSVKHCNAAGCSGDERMLGPLAPRPSNNPFGRPVVVGETVARVLRLAPATYDAVQERAQAAGISVTQWLREAVEAQLERR